MAASTQKNKKTSTARANRSEALHQTRKDLIVDAAKKIFATSGLEGSSMRAIAAEAGCTTGAIYPYFESKEYLYAAVLSNSLHALQQHVLRNVQKHPVPIEGAKAGLQAFFDYYCAHLDELSLGLYLFNGIHPAGLNAKLNRELNKQLRAIFNIIEQQYKQANFKDAEEKTANGVAQAIGLLVLEKTGRIRLFNKSASALFSNYLSREEAL